MCVKVVKREGRGAERRGEEREGGEEGGAILQNASMYYENKCACIIYIRIPG